MSVLRFATALLTVGPLWSQSASGWVAKLTAWNSGDEDTMFRADIFTIWWLTLLFATCNSWDGKHARADVIELNNGGRIEGQLVDPDRDSSADYTILTASGGRITVARSEVARIVRRSPAEEEYERRAQAAADNADAHWQLAQWCRENDLRDQYRDQLARVLELDPNHEQARQALGQQKNDSKWMSRDEIMAARGMVWYDGRYRTRQQIELLEQTKQTRTTEADWSNRLKRWRRWLTGRRQDRADEALREIRSIRDPQAAPAIVDLLRDEQDPAVKHLLIDVAAGIDDPQAADALVTLSLSDPNDEIRYQCLEYLIKSGRPGIAAPYIRALKNPDNVIVNRAAEALQTIGDRNAISPLIGALVTKHKFQTSGGSPDQHSYIFTPSGGTAMNFGSSGPKFVTQEVENRSVLTALVKLSGGVSFGYNQQQWRGWLAAQEKANPVDVRRDP
jgi:HEAT repeats/PBS lyase HEAT-like repeat